MFTLKRSNSHAGLVLFLASHLDNGNNNNGNICRCKRTQKNKHAHIHTTTDDGTTAYHDDNGNMMYRENKGNTATPSEQCAARKSNVRRVKGSGVWGEGWGMDWD